MPPLRQYSQHWSSSHLSPVYRGWQRHFGCLRALRKQLPPLKHCRLQVPGRGAAGRTMRAQSQGKRGAQGSWGRESWGRRGGVGDMEQGHEHTIWWGCWRGHGHTGAIVQPLPIGTGADRPTGAQQAEPFTLLAVTGVGHCGCDQGWKDAEPQGPRTFPHPLRPKVTAWRLCLQTCPLCLPSGCLCWWYRTTSEAWLRPPVRLIKGLCPNLWILKTRLLM